MRAWGGFSIRALGLVSLAILATHSLVTHWREWLWTEWAAFVSAAIIAGCWVYDEFVARPALDRTVHLVLLGTWLLALGLIAGVSLWAWTAVSRRFWPDDATSESRAIQPAGDKPET